MSRARALRLAFPLALVAACGSKGSSAPPPDDVDLSTFITAPESCAYACPVACAEQDAPYACPSMPEWSTLPHADTCGAWDGKYPAPQQGQCTATAPTGDAAKYAGPEGTGYILPDGRRVHPSGAEWIFTEPDLLGGLTSAVLRIPKTSFVLTVDTGPGDHAVRVVDATKVGTGNPVTSYVRFARPSTLNSGMAFIAPDLVYVATNDGDVQALKLDTATGQLTRDDGRSIKLDPTRDSSGNLVQWYTSGVAASPDGSRLVVTPV